MNPPYFDHRKTYDVAFLARHELQKLFALFVSKPELYKDIEDLAESDKQDYMFHNFHMFIRYYYNLNLEKQYDESVYFASLFMDKAGSVNVCGGGGSISNSGRRQFIGGYKAGQAARKANIEYLTKKYGLVFKTVDPRTFIGHQEPWKNLSPALLEKEGWGWVAQQGYTDETFAAPFPEKMDGDLVPLAIRNKALQKWKAHRKAESDKAIAALKPASSEEDEEDAVVPQTPTPENIKKIVLSEEDLKLIMDEDW